MDYPYSNGYQQQAYMTPQYTYPMQPRQMPQQQPQQPQTLIGRVIANENDIRPSDVTEDGSMSWYPTQDNSSVICRWKRVDGTIGYLRYVPERQEPPQPTQADRIEEKLNCLLNMLSKPTEEATNAE